MGFKYAIFHWFFHLLPVILLYSIFRLNFFDFFIIFISAGIIDIDHLPLIKKQGLINWAKNSMKSHIPRRYGAHNFATIFIFFILSSLIFSKYFLIGICSLVIALHLLWDFFEDVFIFRIGIKHWMI